MHAMWRAVVLGAVVTLGVVLGAGLVRVAAQAFRRDRVRRVQDALEDDAFGWNDRYHLTIMVRAVPANWALSQHASSA